MKKALLTKLMFLLCALIAGSSSVWADEYELYSGDLTEGDYVIYYGGKAMNTTVDKNRLQYLEVTPTDDKISDPDAAIIWHIAKSGDYWTIYNATAEKYAASTGTKNQATMSESGTDDKSLWTVEGDGTYEFVNKANNAAGVNCNLRNNGTYGFACYATGTGGPLSLYKKSSAVSTKVSKPSISGAVAFLTSVEVTLKCGTADATILYSTDNGTNWSTYSTPLEFTETTTLKAKATKSGLEDSDEVEGTFTKVTETMSVSEALNAIDALADNGTIENKAVAGIVSQVDKFSSGSIMYWISDDGSTTSQLEVFYGKGLNGADFTKLGDLMVGDEVTVYGTLKKYVSGDYTTPEFVSGSFLLSYENTGKPKPVIKASNTTIESFATSGEIAYTVENPTGAALTAEIKEGDWISNLNVTADKVTFSATQNEGDKRNATITLKYEGADNKVVTIYQKASFGVAKLPFAFDGGKDDIDGTETIPATPGLAQNGLGDYNYSPRLKFDGTGDYLILKISDLATPEILNFDIKGNSFSSDPEKPSTFKVQTSEDGVTFTDLKTYTELGALSHESFALDGSVRFVKWIYTEKGSGNVALGRIGVNCEAVTISDAGYITFCFANNIDFEGTGVTAYVVPNIGTSTVTIEEIDKAPANTPLILEAAAGTYALGVPASVEALTTINMLRVSDGTKKGDFIYVLANKDNGVGFYKLKNTISVPAGKCYLDLTVDAPEYLGFADDVTGIDNVQSSKFNVQSYYNLAGQRVANPTKGLYIVNGRKVVIK